MDKENIGMRKNTLNAALMLAMLAFGSAAYADTPYQLSPAAIARGGERLALGFEDAGVRIDRVYWTEPEEYCWLQGFRLTNNRRVTPLYNLQELKGVVHIEDCADALKYVRLQTSPMTWNLMSGHAAGEMEIVTPTQAARLPSFGLAGNFVSMDPDAVFAISDLRLPPGLGGIIPEPFYHRGRFAPAKAERISGGFKVTRWIFLNVYPNGKRKALASKVSEIITPMGGYTRTILLQKIVEIPGIVLRLPRYSGE